MHRLIVAENRIVDALSRWIGQAASSSSGGAISTHHFSPSSQLSSTTSSSMPLIKSSGSLSRRGAGRERPSVSMIRHANSPRSSSDCLSTLHLQGLSHHVIQAQAKDGSCSQWSAHQNRRPLAVHRPLPPPNPAILPQVRPHHKALALSH